MCSAVGQNYRLQDIQLDLPPEGGSCLVFFDIVWDDSRCPRRYLARPTRDPRPQVSGGHRREVTPVPIPNTEVKLSSADGTAWETAWESRSLPGLTRKARRESDRPFFMYARIPQLQAPAQARAARRGVQFRNAARRVGRPDRIHLQSRAGSAAGLERRDSLRR